MKKFTIQSKKGTTSIIELDVEFVTALEDPSVMWLPAGEFKVKILKPTTFHQKIEKTIDGKRETILVPDVWFSHAIYDTKEQALLQAKVLVKQEFDFNFRKYGKTYSQEDLDVAILAIEL